MKKLMSILTAGSLCLVATSCTIEVQDENQNDAPVATATPAPEPQSEKEAFLSSIYMEYPQMEYQFGDAWLIELGGLICDAIDEGMTLEQLGLIVIQSEWDPNQIGWIAGAAIGSFCPENRWFIESAGI